MLLPADLAKLTDLSLMATDDAALAGLSAAPQLQRLYLSCAQDPIVNLEDSRCCTPQGLLHSLTTLTALTQLELHQLSGSMNEDEWRELLRGLRHVEEVSIRTRQCHGPAMRAWRSLRTHKPSAVMFEA
jgi:hypothetical protein